MRPFLMALAAVAVLGGAACSNNPEIAVAAGPNDTRVASVRGEIPPHEVRSALLFASAEATLETGGRFFRVLGATQHGNTPNIEPSYAPAAFSLREGDMVFATDPGPADGQDVRDAVVVVLSSRPELRSRLSEPARRQLELFKQAAK